MQSKDGKVNDTGEIRHSHHHSPSIVTDETVHSGAADQEFPRGENEHAEPKSRLPAAGGESPAVAASFVAKHLRGSALSIIHACRCVHEMLNSFDDADTRAFIGELVQQRVVPAQEAKLSTSSGTTLSKHSKIGANADLLLRAELTDLLPTGYTTLYHLVGLYEAIPEADKEKKFQALLAILHKRKGAITRGYLVTETRNLKKGGASDAAANEGTHSDEVKPGILREGEAFNLVLVTPSPADIRLLGADYPDLDTLERDLPFSKFVHKNAVIVVAAPLGDFAVVVEKLLPLFGFEKPRHVLLPRPSSIDVIKDVCFVVAQRGSAQVVLPKSIDDAAATAVATQLYQSAENKLHVFAAAETSGWTALVGDDSWTTKTGGK